MPTIEVCGYKPRGAIHPCAVRKDQHSPFRYIHSFIPSGVIQVQIVGEENVYNCPRCKGILFTKKDDVLVCIQCFLVFRSRASAE